jgi:microcystin-dependent protein
MSDPFIGQIALFGFNFAPRGWATCSGQVMPLSQNVALFSILGTAYGGNGRTTFALPDLRGAAAIGAGQGPALSEYGIGETGGTDNVELVTAEMPQHSHAFAVSTDQASAQEPANNVLARAVRPLDGGDPQAPGPRQAQVNFYSPNPQNARSALAANAIGPTGGDKPHNNMQPYLALNFCIALLGEFPPHG